MSSVAQEAPPNFAPPALPSWGTAATAAFLGWTISAFSVGGVGLAANALGLLGRVEGTGLRDWPFPAAGWESTAANTVVWLWILALTALLVRGMLADRVGRPVSALPICAVLAITGFVPLLPRGLIDLPWPVAFLATAALLRYVPDLRVPVFSKRLTARLLAVGALFLAIPTVHALRHPLWPGGSEFGPSTGTTTFSVQNTGFAEIQLERVLLRTPGQVLPLQDVRVDSKALFEAGGRFESPRLPFTIESRSEVFVQLRHGRLGCGVMPAKAVVRYRVNGGARSVSLPLTIEGRKAC